MGKARNKKRELQKAYGGNMTVVVDEAPVLTPLSDKTGTGPDALWFWIGCALLATYGHVPILRHG